MIMQILLLMYHQHINYLKMFKLTELQTSSINLEKYGVTGQNSE